MHIVKGMLLYLDKMQATICWNEFTCINLPQYEGIGNPDYLKQTMHNGNKLYSSLLQLSRYKTKAIVFSCDIWRHPFTCNETDKNIRGVNNLLEEINNIINEKERNVQAMEYDIQLICFSCKITEIERKRIVRKHRKKTYVWQQGSCFPKKVSRSD